MSNNEFDYNPNRVSELYRQNQDATDPALSIIARHSPHEVNAAIGDAIAGLDEEN